MNNAAAISLDSARRHASETVKQSGTSFAAGMRILSKPRRDAMYAIYAFCREVDDIADEGGTQAEKLAGLAAWREEVDRIYAGRPQYPTGVALREAVEEFNLPKDEFFAMIEGMETDANGPVIAPSMEELLHYTRCVAGSVGMLSMPAFGAPKNATADKFALSLGDALQLTNILRDVAEDAEIGRLYLPRELLEKHGAPLSPDAIVDSPALPKVAEELGSMAAQKFADAREALSHLDWRILRPALLMMGVYETYLKKMQARGWDKTGEPLDIPKSQKMAIAARWFIAPRMN